MLHVILPDLPRSSTDGVRVNESVPSPKYWFPSSKKLDAMKGIIGDDCVVLEAGGPEDWGKM